jgi:hypothetical protein
MADIELIQVADSLAGFFERYLDEPSDLGLV